MHLYTVDLWYRHNTGTPGKRFFHVVVVCLAANHEDAQRIARAQLDGNCTVIADPVSDNYHNAVTVHPPRHTTETECYERWELQRIAEGKAV